MNTLLKPLARSLLALSLIPALAGCGYLFGDDGVFRDKSEDYKVSPEKPKLKVPEGKDSSALHDIYVVPPVQDSVLLPGEFEVPRPNPLLAGSSDEIVRIQRLGDDSWALVNMAPGQLWPQVRSFITATGVQVGRVDARAGIMETGWLEIEDRDMDARFQFRIEQGVQRGSSELHILHMNQAGDGVTWPERSDDLELEKEMLQGVAQFIANSADSAPVSMIADQAISATGKISLQEAPDGRTFIQVGLPYQRAWASLANALQKSTFEITDRDRSRGEYYVTFLGPDNEEEDGWFDWLFADDEHPLAGQPFLVKVEKQSEDSVAISLLPVEGVTQSVEPRQEQALLSLIKGNIN